MVTAFPGDRTEAGVLTPFCRILGPTEIEINGVPADLGGPRARQVLTLLSTGGGYPVSDEQLIELFWRNSQRRNAVQALRTIVNRLRAGLGPEAGHRYLRRGRGGYALTIPPEQTDHGLLPVLIARAQQQLAGGNAAAAVRGFAAAVTLWRGDPWQEIGEVLELAGPRVRLGELHETAVEELQAARLTLGDTTSALAALTHAVEVAPYRERRWELLALGLYRSARQTEALAVLQRIRERLRVDTGTDPGPALRTLEYRILHQDPALFAPGFATAIAARHIPSVTRPAELVDEVDQGTAPVTVLRIELPPELDGPVTTVDRFQVPSVSGLWNINGNNVVGLYKSGCRFDTCVVDPHNAADAVRRSLHATQYDVVFVDAAFQFSVHTRLLETIVNLAHALQPRCRFVFGPAARLG